MTISTPITPASVTPGSGDDVLCLHCEYSLRGLPREGRCPECGAPAEPSFHRYELALARGWTPLHTASPAFLRRMKWACGLALLSAALCVLAGCGSLSGMRGGPIGPAIAAFWMLPMLTLPAALWLVGSAEPAAHPQRPLRWAVRLGVLLGPWQVVALLLLFRNGVTPTTMEWFHYRAIGETVVVVIVTWAALRRIAQLMRRAERRLLSARLAVLGWALPAVMLVQIFFVSRLYVREHHVWLLAGKPMIGEPLTFLLLPYTLIVWPRLDPILIFWIAYLAMTAATLAMLAQAIIVFSSSSGRSAPAPASSPSAEPEPTTP